jgi:hypothetical protein
MMVAVSGVAIAFALAVLIVLWAGGKRWNARAPRRPSRSRRCACINAAAWPISRASLEVESATARRAWQSLRSRDAGDRCRAPIAPLDAEAGWYGSL